jgi:hypothetical protein
MAEETIKSNMQSSDNLNRVQTAQSVNISMEMFEKMYLAPQNRIKGELRRTFANPTPL